MTLIRWSPSRYAPLRDLPTIQDEVNRLFDNFFTRESPRGDMIAVFTPMVDIEETPEEFLIRADLPGVAQKDVKVSLMGDTLTLRGERRQESPAKDAGHHRYERVFGSFERSFSLGKPVRNDQVKAQYRDGVLEIRVPKAEEARVREIQVQVG
jgi:HSP20 family protein